MDVRVKVEVNSGGPARDPEILTGLRDGTLRSLMSLLLDRHPEIGPAMQTDRVDSDLMEIFVNNRRVVDTGLESYALKDGDTVDLHILK